jgi:flagellar protein FlaG
MDKAIVTVLLIICGVTATLAIFNGVYPAITESQGAISGAAAAASDKIGSRIEVIQTSASGNQVDVWVKNTGTTIVYEVEKSDIFLTGNSSIIMPESGGTSAPYWNYTLTGSHTEWAQTGTVKITITLAAPLSSGTYEVKVVIPNGVSDTETFSVG